MAAAHQWERDIPELMVRPPVPVSFLLAVYTETATVNEDEQKRLKWLANNTDQIRSNNNTTQTVPWRMSTKKEKWISAVKKNPRVFIRGDIRVKQNRWIAMEAWKATKK